MNADFSINQRKSDWLYFKGKKGFKIAPDSSRVLIAKTCGQQRPLHPRRTKKSIQLQEDFEAFYENWDGLNLDGKKFAVFAPGDSSYEYFCGSVDMLEEKMEAMGGKLINDGLKIATAIRMMPKTRSSPGPKPS